MLRRRRRRPTRTGSGRGSRSPRPASAGCSPAAGCWSCGGPLPVDRGGGTSTGASPQGFGATSRYRVGQGGFVPTLRGDVARGRGGQGGDVSRADAVPVGDRG